MRNNIVILKSQEHACMKMEIEHGLFIYTYYYYSSGFNREYKCRRRYIVGGFFGKIQELQGQDTSVCIGSCKYHQSRKTTPKASSIHAPPHHVQYLTQRLINIRLMLKYNLILIQL